LAPFCLFKDVGFLGRVKFDHQYHIILD